MTTRKVTITITNKVVGSYEARSYPHDSQDHSDKIELYKVPVYDIIVSGTDETGKPRSIVHKAPRFMPYWNDPKRPDLTYKTRGWVNAGLAKGRLITVTAYKRDYAVHNRYSPGRGAIVLKGAFYIHAGPASIADYGFGSAGCVEIIGDYDIFKRDIASLSGLKGISNDDAIQTLITNRHLTVVIHGAVAPSIKKFFTRKIARDTWR